MKSQRVSASGELRRSQLLLGTGPGAVLDLVEDAVVIAGLDAWRYGSDTDGFFSEPRLEQSVLKLLTKMDGWRHSQVRLREPPRTADQESSPKVGIPVIRFPKWFLCQNPDCRSLVRSDSAHLKDGKHACRMNPGKGPAKSAVVPVRFVSACPQGHLQDIDWRWFVHRDRERGPDGGFCTRQPGKSRANDPLGEDWNTDLYLQQRGTSGDLTDYVVGCRKCGDRRGLQDLAGRGVGACRGEHPHLGRTVREAGKEGCKGAGQDRKGARLLTRTASNAYFPIILSALSIPDPGEELTKAIKELWSYLEVATPETLPIFLQLPAVATRLKGYRPEQILAELQRLRQGAMLPVPGIREIEDAALAAAEEEKPGDLPRPGTIWHARKVKMAGLPAFIEEVVLVKHLTEVRAQVAFTRIDAHVGDAEGEYELQPTAAPLATAADWVPAVKIQGEGFFVRLNGTTLDRWAQRPAVQARAAAFVAAENDAARREGRLPKTTEDIRFLMLHTLSHMLIQSISLDCGYPASAIRERLYCAVAPGPTKDSADHTLRAGILLFTGTPGSEGTLGGLVEVGRNLKHHLRKAVELGMLCSNDPVCAQHRPDDGQEGRHREGAACHGCVLIGEPSCERSNRDLDRSLVVPTVEEKEAAFLKDWLADLSL
jgi:Domain of unknown function (DUF1998)